MQKIERSQHDLEAKRQELREATHAISVALETEISASADARVLLNQAIAEVDKVYRLERWTEEMGPEIQVG